jgi:23S rRNA pseudouridine1911/1915/1917 synthase
MKNHFDIRIPPGQKKERIDAYLTRHVENASRNKVQEAIRTGAVLVNGAPIKPSYPVQPGDTIHIQLNRPEPPIVQPEDIPLEIVFEDEFLLVVNKPAGMVTHPAYKNYSGTLVNALLHHTERLSDLHPPEMVDGTTVRMRPGIVHRLDKDTSGLLVIAKNEVTHRKLARQFELKSTEREYQALVWGRLKSASGTIDAPLGRSKRDRKKVAVMPEGKHAVTDYTVLERFDFLTLLSLRLRTGRTHQIRVHCASIHHPVFGDGTYGGREIVSSGVAGKKRAAAHHLLAMMPRQALHAKTLGFIHPETRKMMRFTTELPDDMRMVLDRLRSGV